MGKKKYGDKKDDYQKKYDDYKKKDDKKRYYGKSDYGKKEDDYYKNKYEDKREKIKKCTREFDPVCCSGRHYDNACIAEADGIKSASKECKKGKCSKDDYKNKKYNGGNDYKKKDDYKKKYD